MKTVELYLEPRNEIFSRMSFPKGEPEMTEFESGFMCGLLKQYKPKKILEVGIAGGGTSAIILQCMSNIGDDYQLFSCDLTEKFYRNSTKETGYLVHEAYQYIKTSHHKIFLGDIASNFIDEIGQDIDFLILDTTHTMPGEILDFISLLPYLKDDAIVVLHDISANHINRGKIESFCTRILFDSVVGDKYYMPDVMSENRIANLPNIAAFRITEDTRRYIVNCFSSLLITWPFKFSEDLANKYRKAISSHYDKEYVDLLDSAILANHITYMKINRFSRKIMRIGKIILRGGLLR